MTHRSRPPVAEGPPPGALVEPQWGRSPETQPTVGWTCLTVRCPLERLLRLAVEPFLEDVAGAPSERAELNRELLQTVRRELAARWRARQLETSWLRTAIRQWADFDGLTQRASCPHADHVWGEGMVASAPRQRERPGWLHMTAASRPRLESDDQLVVPGRPPPPNDTEVPARNAVV